MQQRSGWNRGLINEKMYQISVPQTGEDVMGGDVSESNAYIAAYPPWLENGVDYKTLEVGQSTLASYSLSGSSGIYRVRRVG